MWELRRADLELVKQKLAELRSITLRRHEKELKQLEADQAEIDTLARLAAAVTEKYLGNQNNALKEDVLIAQNVSPNFPRFVGRMASD